MSVKPVREVSPWSLGSGVRLRELIQLPKWAVIAGELLGLCAAVFMWLIRHYIVTGTVLMFVLSVYQFGLVWWWVGLLIALVVPAAYWVCRIALLLHAGEASTVRAVLVGMWRIRKIRAMWPGVLFQLKIAARGQDATAPLVNALPTNTGLAATVVTGAVAMPSNKLTKLEAELASGLFCDRVTVRPITPSTASIRFDWGQHLRQIYRLHDLPPVTQKADSPARIRFGVQADGDPATITSNLATLIGGLSGSGKSSAMWAIIAGYLEAVPVRLRVIDPSGVEFVELGKRLGDGIVHDYISNVDDLDEFWERYKAAFDRRMQAVEKSGQRWHQPTKREPLDLLVIDEILPIAAQLRKDATDHAVGRSCYLGRKLAFAVIAASQAGQVDTLGRIRDLFPQRLSFRTASRYLTDAFLGDGAHSDGATASDLDVEHDLGVGYMAAPGQRGYMSFRSAWVPDTETRQIAQGIRPVYDPNQASSIRNKPTALYLFHNSAGEKIYYGIAEAGRLDTRWSEHARSKEWWPEVARKEVVHTYPDRETAETAEALAIRRHRPRYNVQHNAK